MVAHRSATEIARTALAAVLLGDRTGAESLLATDFVCLLPNDEVLNRSAALQRWCAGDPDLIWLEVSEVIAGATGQAVIKYESEQRDGTRCRSCLWIKVRAGQVVSAEVFVG